MSIHAKLIGNETYIFIAGDLMFVDIFRATRQNGKLVFGKIILFTCELLALAKLTYRDVQMVEGSQVSQRYIRQTSQNNRELLFHGCVIFQI